MTVPQQRVLVTELPGPRSRVLHERRVGAVPRAAGSVMPLYVDRAEGSILLDVDGNQILDFGSGIAVSSVGHSHPAVVAAVTEQASKFTHTCFGVNPYEPYVALAERLNELTPGSHEKRTVFSNSGSEAVENAVKIARRATGRSAIVTFEHGYHGRTNLTLAMTSKATPYKTGLGPFAGDVHRAPAPYPYRWPTGSENCLEEAFEAFVQTVHLHVGEEQVAAVVLEPVLGEAGFIVPPAGYLSRLRQWCTDHGVVFVADEVQSGLCRTGDWFAVDHEGVVPDLVVTGKALGSGLPIGAVTGRADVIDAVQPGGMGGTTAGNPVSCAAALATLDVMADEDLNARARWIGEVMTGRLQEMANRFDVIGEVRGRGAMVAVELVVDGGDRSPHPAMTQAVAKACHAAGLIAMQTGPFRNCLRLLPPLTISEDLLRDGLDVLEQAFATAA
jgi:4-aminobutyrate aminotransferase/(S)-3-amino-2-methylpropionate transaminase